MDPIKVMSIDIGIINIGMVFCYLHFPELEKSSKYKNRLLNKEYHFTQNVDIIDCNRIDITKMKHSRVKRCACTLHHERCIPDYLDHFVQEYSEYFESCDILLLERQPPVGITNVQDLLFTKFRHKVLLVSPNTVHKYFGLDSEYSIRKMESESIAEKYLSHFKGFIENTRKHDISDSLLLVLYYYKTKVDEQIECMDYEKEIIDFEQFRF